MLTAYDYPTAVILDAVGIPFIFVGDTLGVVILGYDSTVPVTTEVACVHTARDATRHPKPRAGVSRLRLRNVTAV